MATILVSLDTDSDIDVTNIYLRKGNKKYYLNFDTDDSECNGVEVTLTLEEIAKLKVLLNGVKTEEVVSTTNIETSVRG